MCWCVHRKRRARRERERRGPALARGAVAAMARAVVVVARRRGDVEDVVRRGGPVVVVRTDGALCRAFVGGRVGVGDETREFVGEVHVAAAARAVVVVREFPESLGHGEVGWRGDKEVVGVKGAAGVGGGAIAARGRGGRGRGEVEALLAMGFVV